MVKVPLPKLPHGDIAVLLQFTRDSSRLIVCTVQYKVVIFDLVHADVDGGVVATATLFKSVNAMDGELSSHDSDDDDAASESTDTSDGESGSCRRQRCAYLDRSFAGVVVPCRLFVLSVSITSPVS